MYNALCNIAIEASIKAGKRVLEIYNTENFDIQLKADDTPITQADRESNIIITSALESTSIPIISEESIPAPYEERKQWEKFWLIDPLDGTKEFINKNGEFTINIALVESNKPILGVIYAPVLQELYVGIVGKEAYKVKIQDGILKEKINLPLEQKGRKSTLVVNSRSWKDTDTELFINNIKGQVEIVSRGSSLKLCMIAEGTADVYPRFVHLKEWDIGAGVAIVLASGGNVKNHTNGMDISLNSCNLDAPFFIARKNNN